MTVSQLVRAAEAADDILRMLRQGEVVKRDRARDPLTERGFLALVRSLSKDMQDATRGEEEKAYGRALGAIDRNWATTSEAERDAAFRQVGRFIAGIARAVSPELGALLRGAGGDVVRSTRGAMAGQHSLPIQTSLSLADGRVIDHAASAQSFYVTDQYGKRAAKASELARQIVSDGQKKGLGGRDIRDDLEVMLADSLGRSHAYFDSVASIFVARSRSYGQLASMSDAGITRFAVEAVMDEVTCFAPGTRVLMASGRMKRIERVHAGEHVISCRGRPRRVKATRRQGARTWITIRTADGRTLRVTQQHGFLTQDGWIRARTLEPDVDKLAVYREEGSCAARNLFPTDPEDDAMRAWMSRLGKHTAKTINAKPYPHPWLRRMAQFSPIVDIDVETSGRTLDSFDLEVEDDLGYVVNGYIVHNSAICRYMNGRTFDVQAARQRFEDVAASDDPDAVKELQPFVQHGRDEDGKEILFYKRRGGELVRVADVLESGLGKLNGKGSFANGMDEAQLVASGIIAPPYHGECRTTLVMVE